MYVYIRTGVATVLGFRTYIYTYESTKGLISSFQVTLLLQPIHFMSWQQAGILLPSSLLFSLFISIKTLKQWQLCFIAYHCLDFEADYIPVYKKIAIPIIEITINVNSVHMKFVNVVASSPSGTWFVGNMLYLKHVFCSVVMSIRWVILIDR